MHFVLSQPALLLQAQYSSEQTDGCELGAELGPTEPLGSSVVVSGGALETILGTTEGNTDSDGALDGSPLDGETLGKSEGNNDSDGPLDGSPLDGETLGKSEGNNDSDGAPVGSPRSQVDTY